MSIDIIHQKGFLQCSYDSGRSWLLMNNVLGDGSSDAVLRDWQQEDNIDFNMNSSPGPVWFLVQLVSGRYRDITGYGFLRREWKLGEPGRHSLSPSKLISSFCLPSDPRRRSFNLINNSVPVVNNGWMVDNLEVYYVEGCGPPGLL